MKKIVYLTGLFLLVALLPAGRAAAADYSFDRTVHDFGRVQTGKTVETHFTVTNDGTVPLLITDAAVSCKCLKVGYPKEPILPGKSAEVTVSHKDRHPGAFYKVVELKTNADPARTRLTLKGTLVKKLP